MSFWSGNSERKKYSCLAFKEKCVKMLFQKSSLTSDYLSVKANLFVLNLKFNSFSV
jgi:hypothetical protein